MSRILFIHGGDAHARAIFADSGEAYWSQALPLVLEKHGLLGVTESHALEWDDSLHDAVLVAQQPAATWTHDRAESLARSSVPVLVEGPHSGPMLSVLGVEDHGGLPLDGSIQVRDAGLKEAASRYGIPPHWAVRPSGSSEIARPAELEWRALGVPITDEQAAAWRTERLELRRWHVTDADAVETLAEWVSGDSPTERFPVIVRRDSLIACAFGLFDLLGRRHTSEPFDPGEWRTSPRSAGLEAILLGLVDEMHRSRGASRARVLPWPDPYRWVQTVRHDFDRPLSADDTKTVLEAHRRLGTRATWYWRPRHADSEALQLVADEPNHEIALHTEAIWAEEDGRQSLEAAIGRKVLGTAAHGGSDCFRYQGAPNVLWADREGLSYTELPQQWHLHPHRFAALLADGRIAPLQIVCLPHHLSFDRSSRPGDTLATDIDRALPLWRAAGGLAQIMNHPDINAEAFSAWLSDTPDEARLAWTAAEAADWWRRTHFADELTVTPLPGGAVAVTSRHGVDGLVVERLEADGTRTEHVLNVAAGENVIVEPAAHGPSWSDVSDAFADAVRAHHAARDEDPDSPAVLTTIRTNGELVPQRGDLLLRLLTEMTGVEPSGRRVLDLGCGFGALATYLAWKGEPDELIAVDTRADYVAVARQCADAIGLSDVLDFQVADMRDLHELGHGTFDLVIANNSFIYLATPEDVKQALREIHAVLRPGGHVLFYQANKWRWDEPFTKDPLVHLLPPWLSRPVTRVTGWRDNHGRVRLLSPLEFRRRLRRAGFEGFSVQTFGKHRESRTPLKYFGGFYAVAARRSGR